MARVMDTAADRARQPSGCTPAWVVVTGRELADLWTGGRGLALVFAYTLVLSVTAYLVGVSEQVDFLEQRDAVGTILQVAVAVGSLLVLLAAADAISGERERETLETLLLTPAPRRALVAGKGVAALSLWAGAFGVSVPYLWFLSRGVGLVGPAIGVGLLVGTALTLFLVGLGLLVSTLARSNRVSLSVSLFVLLALLAPTQLPGSVTRTAIGQAFERANPFTSGLRLITLVIVDGHRFGQEWNWLIGPVIAAVLAVTGAVLAAGRLTLVPGRP